MDSTLINPKRNDIPSFGTLTSDDIADVRISIGCLSSHRRKTLKAIIPASIGS